jgi:hypothetical protein
VLSRAAIARAAALVMSLSANERCWRWSHVQREVENLPSAH